MVIALIIAIPVSFILGAFITAKAMQLGLKYKMQVEKGIEPKLNPVKDVLDDIATKKEADKANNEVSEMLSDIFGGE